jgi:hypothetical protein
MKVVLGMNESGIIISRRIFAHTTAVISQIKVDTPGVYYFQ